MLFLASSIFRPLTSEQRKAIEELFRTQGALYYNIAYQGVQSPHIAQELVAESFVKMMRVIDKIMTLTPQQREAYGVMVVKREVLQYVRSQKNTRSIVSYEEYTPPDERSDVCVENDVISILDLENMNKMLDGVSEQDRMIVVLHYGYSMTYTEIAEIVNLTPANAQKRGNRLMKKLRKMADEQRKLTLI